VIQPTPAPVIIQPTPAPVIIQPTPAPPASEALPLPVPGGRGGSDEVTRASKPVIERGTGQFVNAQAASKVPPPAPAGDVTFNFEGESIQAVIAAILGQVMQENYVIAPGVQGQVTFSTAKPISASQALSVLEMLLSWNNATLVYKDGRYTVLPVQQAVQGNLTPRVGGVGDARGYEVRVVPLHFISATEMEKLLQPYSRPGAVIKADNARAMIVLGGTKADLQNYLDTIETFDVDWLAGMSIGIFPLERVEAKVVVPELEKIFGDGAATPLAGMFRFLPIERLNAVLVITPQQKYLDTAQQWLSKLDRGGSDAGAQLYVYYVKNVKAKDLAANLTDVFGGAKSTTTVKNAPVGAVVPGIESVEIKSINNPTAQDKNAMQKTTQTTGPSGGIGVNASDNIRITAIEESNALLIKATPGEYDSILQAIKRLDDVPLQVHIEAKILQVDLTDSLSFGVKSFFENSTAGSDGGVNLMRTTQDYRRNTRGYDNVVAGALPARNAWNSFAGNISSAGLGWTFVNLGAEAVLSALDSVTNTRVLAAPSLVALNNKKASFNVGKQIPVVSVTNGNFIGSVQQNGQNGTGTATPFVNSGFGQVQFRDTGIILHVTPRVNPGGLVFLELKQENSTPSDTPDPTGNVSVSKAEIETEVAVQSGQTVMLGGLIKESNDYVHGGVPGLSRIPVVGGLFGNQKKTKLRQEILVLITPTVIENSQQAQEVTDDYKRRFRSLKPLLKESNLLAPDATNGK
jgi:general secretion pathway protein D